MITIFIRTLIIYTVLIGVMRIMGKRQVGELEVSDLVTTLLLSEIATGPIENCNIPIIHAVVPIVTLLSVEVIISVALTKSQRLKNLFGGKPATIIRNGILDQKELKNNRISLDELLSELRQSNVTNISDVKYAILEHNGKFSIIRPADAKESGIAHPIILDGKISIQNLIASGKDRDWLNEQIQMLDYKSQDIFLMTIDDSGKVDIIRKEI